MQKHAEELIVCEYPNLDPQEITHRFTVVIHRQTGEIEELGPVEHWAKLPKYKQQGSGKPAKISLTVFGNQTQGEPRPESTISHPSSRANPSSSTETPDVETPSQEDAPKEAWGAPPVANHGPGFLSLSPREQSEIRRLHHNLGHPDGDRFVRYLRPAGACDAVLKGARDYQCEACVESKRGS